MKKNRVVGLFALLLYVHSALWTVPEMGSDFHALAEQENVPSKKNESLSKFEMLEHIRQHIQRMGFSKQDAQKEVESLQDRSLMEIRDIHRQSQRVQQSKVVQENEHTKLERHLNESVHLQKRADEKIRYPDIPVVTPVVTSFMKNIQKLFDIPDGSQASLLSGIAGKMEQLGFAKRDIDYEIYRLQRASVTDLKTLYPTLAHQLQEELNEKSFYADSSSVHGKKVDSAVQFAHQWGSTVATIAAVGFTSLGYDPTMLTGISTSVLLDPRLTYFNELTKTDFLELLYAHYDSYNEGKNLYLDPHYKASLLMPKKDMLSVIARNMEKLDISSHDIKIFLKSYQQESLEDVRFAYASYEKLADGKVALTAQDKNIAQMTRAQLVKGFRSLLKNKNMALSKDVIQQTIQKFEGLDLGQLQTVYQDLQSLISSSDKKITSLPAMESKLERVLTYVVRQQPMIAEQVKPFLLDRIKNNLITQGKSDAYIALKMKHLEDLKVDPAFVSIKLGFLSYGSV